MAISPFITSALQKLRIKDVQRNRPNSEAVNSKIGASVNALIDAQYYEQKWEWDGFNFDNFLYRKGAFRMDRQLELIYYYLYVEDTGANSPISINFERYNSSGALIGNLFGTGANRVLVQGNNVARAYVGRDLVAGSTFGITSGLSSFQYGNNQLSSNTFNAGEMLVPYIQDTADNSRNISFVMRFRPI
jgi:hypothetical protein